MTMADRIAVMDKGKLIHVATPAEVYEAPNCRFVADFIGNVNLFEGPVEATRPGAVDIAGRDGFPIRAECASPPAKGATVWFAVRPEKIRLSRTPPADAFNAVEGEIWDIAYLGDMTIFNIRLPNGRIVKTAQVNAARTSAEPFGYDEKVWLSFAPDAGIVLTS